MPEVLESWGNSENKLYAFILQIFIVYDDSELGLGAKNIQMSQA